MHVDPRIPDLKLVFFHILLAPRYFDHCQRHLLSDLRYASEHDFDQPEQSMIELKFLQRSWRVPLAHHIRSAAADILIASPYVTREGTKLIESSIGEKFRKSGKLTLITDLSPLNVIQGSTDPDALEFLAEHLENFILWLLPRLHAKVYVVDSASAIITSANLTKGGLDVNYEYGVQIDDSDIAAGVRKDLAGDEEEDSG
jgi:HKD family nuclease